MPPIPIHPVPLSNPLESLLAAGSYSGRSYQSDTTSDEAYKDLLAANRDGIAPLFALLKASRRYNRDMLRRDQRIAVLRATYTADRADNVSSNLSALALVSAGLVYLGATAAYILPRCPQGICVSSQVPLPVLWFIPVVPIGLLSFLILVLNSVIIRTNYMLEVEKELQRYIPGRVPAPDGMRRSIEILGPDGSWYFTILNYVTYLGIFAIVLGSTVGPLYLAANSHYHHIPAILPWLIPTIYGGMLIVAIIGLARALYSVKTTSTSGD